MALSLGSVILLLVSLLDVPGSLCRSSALCPHTSFYHDCWIRRFPGLFLNLPGSVQHGAQVLQSQGEPTAQLCSRKCCDHASCNLAVFYSENNEETNCHLIHCPQPESCILQPQEGAVLFTATAGARSLSEGANSEGSLPSLPPLDQPMSDLQSPAHLDSSKQHFNETKGHSGKNQSSDGEVVNTKGPWVGLWLLPGLLGSSMVLLCCCSGILLLGCCRRRKRGRYRPGRVVDSRRGTLIRFAVLKERV
ncbi:MANSC domain-containing protein 4 isoform 2-T3 [Rhinophrynus dorsalis]